MHLHAAAAGIAGWEGGIAGGWEGGGKEGGSGGGAERERGSTVPSCECKKKTQKDACAQKLCWLGSWNRVLFAEPPLYLSAPPPARARAPCTLVTVHIGLFSHKKKAAKTRRALSFISLYLSLSLFMSVCLSSRSSSLHPPKTTSRTGNSQTGNGH